MKNEGTVLPSVRRKITKRTTQEIPLSQSKPEFGQELSNEPGVFATSQPDIAKKIQQKMRIRRATGSEKKLSQMELPSRENTAPRTAEEEEVMTRELQEVVDFLWENNDEVARLLQSLSRVISASQFKAKIMAEAGILRCQVHNGDCQEVILSRTRRVGDLLKRERKCAQHEKQVQRMIEERMEKLNGLLR